MSILATKRPDLQLVSRRGLRPVPPASTQQGVWLPGKKRHMGQNKITYISICCLKKYPCFADRCETEAEKSCVICLNRILFPDVFN